MRKRILPLLALLPPLVLAAPPSMNDVQSALRAQNYPQASALLEAVLREKPDSAKALYLYAQVKAKQNDSAAARALLERAKRADPTLAFAGSKQQLAGLERYLGMTPASTSPAPSMPAVPVAPMTSAQTMPSLTTPQPMPPAQIKPATATPPSLTTVQNVIKAGDYPRAAGLLEDVLRAKPDSAKAFYYLAQVRLKLGDKAAASAALNRAKTLEPSLSFASSPAQVAELEQAIVGKPVDTRPTVVATPRPAEPTVPPVQIAAAPPPVPVAVATPAPVTSPAPPVVMAPPVAPPAVPVKPVAPSVVPPRVKVEPAPVAPPVVNAKDKESGSGMGMFMWILFLLAAGGGGYWWWSNRQENARRLAERTAKQQRLLPLVKKFDDVKLVAELQDSVPKSLLDKIHTGREKTIRAIEALRREADEEVSLRDVEHLENLVETLRKAADDPETYRIKETAKAQPPETLSRRDNEDRVDQAFRKPLADHVPSTPSLHQEHHHYHGTQNPSVVVVEQDNSLTGLVAGVAAGVAVSSLINQASHAHTENHGHDPAVPFDFGDRQPVNPAEWDNPVPTQAVTSEWDTPVPMQQASEWDNPAEQSTADEVEAAPEFDFGPQEDVAENTEAPAFDFGNDEVLDEPKVSASVESRVEPTFDFGGNSSDSWERASSEPERTVSSDRSDESW